MLIPGYNIFKILMFWGYFHSYLFLFIFIFEKNLQAKEAYAVQSQLRYLFDKQDWCV